MSKNQKTLSNIKTIETMGAMEMDMPNEQVSNSATDVPEKISTNTEPSSSGNMMECLKDKETSRDQSSLMCSVDMQESCLLEGVTHYYCK